MLTVLIKLSQDKTITVEHVSAKMPLKWNTLSNRESICIFCAAATELVLTAIWPFSVVIHRYTT